jgi:hypothetical protein
LESDSKRTIGLRTALTTEEQTRAKEQIYGGDSPCILGCLMMLAIEQNSANSLDEAAKTYERMLLIGEAGYGPNHPMNLYSLNEYAKLLEKMGKHDKAREMTSRSNAILADQPPEPNDSHTN